MRRADTQHQKLVLVCVNERTDGQECCAQKGSRELYVKLKTAVKAAHLSVRVSRTYCLDNCQSGITIALMPQNVYLGEVTEADIPQILRFLSEREF